MDKRFNLISVILFSCWVRLVKARILQLRTIRFVKCVVQRAMLIIHAIFVETVYVRTVHRKKEHFLFTEILFLIVKKLKLQKVCERKFQMKLLLKIHEPEIN
jgi:hypothetical protein